MKDFIKPKLQKYNSSKIDDFIDKFNKAIAKEKFSLNTSLNDISQLNGTELKMVQEKALSNGYELREVDDNYQSKTYIIKWVGFDDM